MFNLVYQHLQRFAVNRFDDLGLGVVLLQHPFKDLLLLHHVAGVDRAELVAIEHQGGQRFEIVLLVDVFVGRLDEIDVLLLALVVDVFQLGNDLLGLLVIVMICEGVDVIR